MDEAGTSECGVDVVAAFDWLCSSLALIVAMEADEWLDVMAGGGTKPPGPLAVLLLTLVVAGACSGGDTARGGI